MIQPYEGKHPRFGPGARVQTQGNAAEAREERLRPIETTPERNSLFTVLGRLPPELSGKLLAGERTISLREGETLFERGDAGDGCYWLRSGVLAVSVASADGEQRILAILGPGAIVGELAMIDGLPRSATVQAVRDCVLTFVSRAAFTGRLYHPPEEAWEDPAAQAYSHPIRLHTPALVRARVLTSNQWSALAEATFDLQE